MGRQPTVRQGSNKYQQRPRCQQNCASNQKTARLRRRLKVRLRTFSRAARLGTLVLGFFQRHTFLTWCTTMAILAGATTAAITSILDPNASTSYIAVAPVHPSVSTTTSTTTHSIQSASPQASWTQEATDLEPLEPIAPTATMGSTQARQRRSRSSTPASLQSAVGAIAVSCAAGCFLLSQWLKPRPHSVQDSSIRRFASPHAASQLVRQPAQQRQAPNAPSPFSLSSEAAQQQLLNVTSTTFKPTQPTASHTQSAVASTNLPISCDSNLIEAKTAQSTNSDAETVEVSIVPVYEHHSLDWDEPSLADSLDLRQRRPLSYWL